ncbi:MAG TPA: hypothetical protein VFK78_06810 [Gemmatimonadales bacterium]|nr:hypothetical protein [Gemmatimonadales bacterium]
MRVVRAPNDAITFSAPVTGRRCTGLAGVVYSGVHEGDGALVMVRPGLAAGTYPLLAARDTSSPAGAVASVRYQQGDAVYGATLDSGVVMVTGTAAPFDVRVAGSGREMGTVRRLQVTATFSALPVPSDTVSCAPPKP